MLPMTVARSFSGAWLYATYFRFMDVVICAHKLMLLDVENKMMIGRRNAWSMKYRVQEQEENQRGLELLDVAAGLRQ